MKFEKSTLILLFLITSNLIITTLIVSAGSREEVAAATMKWEDTLGQNDPDKIVLLYAADGVLWGTLSPTLRSNRASLREYFVSAFKLLPDLNL